MIHGINNITGSAEANRKSYAKEVERLLRHARRLERGLFLGSERREGMKERIHLFIFTRRAL